MSADGDVQDEVRKLRDEVGELKTTTRVTKHDVANLQHGMNALGVRLEKVVDQISRELKETRDGLASEMRGFNGKIEADFKILSTEIGGITNRQAKGAGFWAGIAATGTFIITASGIIITAAVKLMGNH